MRNLLPFPHKFYALRLQIRSRKKKPHHKQKEKKENPKNGNYINFAQIDYIRFLYL